MYSSYHRRSRGGSASGLDGGIVYGSYTEASTRANAAANPTSNRRRRMMFAAVYGSLGLLAVYTNVLDVRFPTSFSELRRQLSGSACISNIYATSDEVLSIPPLPEKGAKYLPSYIKLCYEWMRQEAVPDPVTPYNNFRVLENEDICLDWSSPHYAMMEIVASQILGKAIPIPGITYAHKCADFRASDEGILGFDWTPIQTIYQNTDMAVNAETFFRNGVDDLRTTCKEVLEAYNPDLILVRSRTPHHPFAFPKSSIMDTGLTLDPVATRTELVGLPATANADNARLAPISAVAETLRRRLHTLAENWVGVTNPPTDEKLAGVVIMVDNNSREMDPAILAEYIPSEVSSISILASPLCVSTNLVTGTACMDYVDQLLNYFTDAYPDLVNSGGPGVTSKIIPSTAAGLSRPMTANTLLCPPGTLSCLPAALGKVPQAPPPDPPIPNPPLPATVLFDVPESGVAASFVDKIGRCGLNPLDADACIKVVQLAEPEDAPTVEGTSDALDPVVVSKTIDGDEASEPFFQAQTTVDENGIDTAADGYTPPAPTPEPGVTAEVTPYESVNTTEVTPIVLDADDTELFSNESPANTGDGTVEEPSSETPPTDEEVAAAVANKEAITTNSPNPSGETSYATAQPDAEEIIVDENTPNLQTTYLDTITYNDLIADRILSLNRISEANYETSDPVVYCPTVGAEGNVQDLEGGYTLSDDGEYAVISDTNGIVTFKSPVTITTLTPQVGEFIDLDGNTFTDQYIEVFDSVLNDYVNVTDTFVSKEGGNIEIDKSIGNLYVDPVTLQGQLLLDGASGDLSDPSDTHTLIEGEVKGVGQASMPLTVQGTTTMTPDGGFEKTGVTNPDGFTQTTNPDEQPMAPEQEYQMPPDTESDGFVTRQLVEYDKCIVHTETNPIHIRSHGSGTVTFDVAQVYKGSDTISWVAVDIVDSTGTETCKKVNGISYGFDTRMAGFEAQCDANGEAVVWVHIHDGSKAIGQSDIPRCNPKKDPNCQPDHTDDIPDRCEPSQDKYANNKCHYRYVIDCNALPTTARRRLQSIDGPRLGGGSLPPAIVMPVPTEKGRVLVQNEDPLFGGSNVFKECTQRRTTRADGKVIYNNFKFGNGIQNAGLIVEGASGSDRGLRGPARNHNLEVINM